MSTAFQHTIQRLNAFTNYEEDVPPGKKNFGLKSIECLLEELQRPARDIPTIHIAGTKGKGSTAWFCGALIRAAGLKVGVYTSPHLVSVCERMSINGIPIAEDTFSNLANQVCDAADRVWQEQEVKATWFDLMTAIALSYFHEEGVHAIVLETGLGGRLDSTNVCDPKVTVITRLGLDHTAILGDALPAIAMEKCGIIKKNIPLVTLTQEEDAMQVIQKVTRLQEAPLKVLGDHFFMTVEEGGIDLDTGQSYYSGLNKKALGFHQWENAALAIMAVEELSRTIDFRFAEEDVRFALEQTEIPGRAQLWKDMLLDGAHNPLSMRTLVDVLRLESYGPMRLIFGACHDKKIKSLLKLLRPWVSSVWCVGVPSKRSIDPDVLAEMASYEIPGVPIYVHDRVSQALRHARKVGGEDPILVTGSLYLVGEALRESFDEKVDLPVGSP